MRIHHLTRAMVYERAEERGRTRASVEPCFVRPLPDSEVRYSKGFVKTPDSAWWEVDVEHPAYPHRLDARGKAIWPWLSGVEWAAVAGEEPPRGHELRLGSDGGYVWVRQAALATDRPAGGVPAAQSAPPPALAEQLASPQPGRPSPRQVASFGDLGTGDRSLLASRRPEGAARITHGAAGLAQWLLGLDAATRPLVEKRLAVCAGCEQRRNGVIGTCRVCGCALQAKVRLAHEHCPLAKW